MYASPGAAVKSMVRWRERCRASKAAPFPDHKPKGASTANKWAYIHVSPTRGSVRPEPEDGRDPETVLVLFDRLDRYRYLTRIYIERKPLDSFHGRERQRARRTLVRFARELCWRGLLKNPPKGCVQNLHGKFPACRHGCRTG